MLRLGDVTEHGPAGQGPGLRGVRVETLRAISEHVHYEIEMLCSVRDALGDHMWIGVEGEYLKSTARNALIESFAIHTRALIDFLYFDPRRASDVVVTDFFTPAEWQAIVDAPDQVDPPWSTRVPRNVRSQKDSPAILEARRRTNTEIAHLSYDRLDVEPDDKPWPVADIVEALGTDLFRFVDQVAPGRVADNFKAFILSIGGRPSETHKARTEPGAPTLPPNVPPRQGAAATTMGKPPRHEHC
jgi:hypothetical protein